MKDQIVTQLKALHASNFDLCNYKVKVNNINNNLMHNECTIETSSHFSLFDVKMIIDYSSVELQFSSSLFRLCKKKVK